MSNFYEDINAMEPFDYQPTTPEYIRPYDNFYLSQNIDSSILNILRNRNQNRYPYLQYSVDLEESNNNQPGCFNTCSSLADPRRPNTVYNFNACMDSCQISGTSRDVMVNKKY